MTKYVLILAAIAILLAPAASAGIVVYGADKPGWITAVGGAYQTEDFADTTLNPGLSYNTSNINATIAGGLFNDWVAPGEGVTQWNFSTPLIGVGANWDLSPLGRGIGVALTVIYGDGTEQVVVPEIPNSLHGAFIGLTSTKPFVGVRYTSGTQTSTGEVNSESLNLDDLVYATEGAPASGVPEPGTWLLCAAGIAAVACKARLRR